MKLCKERVSASTKADQKLEALLHQKSRQRIQAHPAQLQAWQCQSSYNERLQVLQFGQDRTLQAGDYDTPKPMSETTRSLLPANKICFITEVCVQGLLHVADLSQILYG